MRKAMLAVMAAGLLSGCAVSNRSLMPRTPLNGQSDSQIQTDKRECTALAESARQQARNAYQNANTNLFAAGLITGVYLNSDEGPAAENRAYKACMIERGYR